MAEADSSDGGSHLFIFHLKRFFFFFLIIVVTDFFVLITVTKSQYNFHQNFWRLKWPKFIQLEIVVIGNKDGEEISQSKNCNEIWVGGERESKVSLVDL